MNQEQAFSDELLSSRHVASRSQTFFLSDSPEVTDDQVKLSVASFFDMLMQKLYIILYLNTDQTQTIQPDRKKN